MQYGPFFVSYYVCIIMVNYFSLPYMCVQGVELSVLLFVVIIVTHTKIYRSQGLGVIASDKFRRKDRNGEKNLLPRARTTSTTNCVFLLATLISHT